MFTMKTLIVSALVCAMMVLTRAAASPEETSQNDQTESHLVKRSTSCPEGWSLLGGRCYRYVPTRMTWAAAEKNCQSIGGNLASVHNIEEYRQIQRLIFSATHSSNEAWIGGSDAEENNQWFWSDGTSFNFQFWCRGEPDNYGGRQHCTQMNYSGQKCWDDVQCSDQKPSVCAMKGR